MQKMAKALKIMAEIVQLYGSGLGDAGSNMIAQPVGPRSDAGNLRWWGGGSPNLVLPRGRKIFSGRDIPNIGEWY